MKFVIAVKKNAASKKNSDVFNCSVKHACGLDKRPRSVRMKEINIKRGDLVWLLRRKKQ